jgi:CRISPR-associated protein (TIGR02584 family)
MSEKRNILLCVAGMTPQIITETLYALTQERRERVDEIRVITTLSGKKKLLDTLLGEQGKLNEFCAEFSIERDSIKFDEKTIVLLRKPDGENLEDIRTEEENEIAGNQICEIVRELCKDERSRIHASAAGGRKTMSVYLAAAMSLFGRADDTLSHVLVSEDFETGNAPDFFYKPSIPKMLTLSDGREVSTDEAKIYLAEIPFVRLRGVRLNLFQEDGRTYKDAVEKTQEDLHLLEGSNALMIDLKKGTVTLASRFVKLKPREFFVFAMFALFRKENVEDGEGFISLREINKAKLDKICRFLTLARGTERGFEDFEFERRGQFVLSLELGSVRNKHNCSVPEAREKIAQTYSEVFSKIKAALRNAGIPFEFGIDSIGERGTQRYGIKIEPSKINFVAHPHQK